MWPERVPHHERARDAGERLDHREERRLVDVRPVVGVAVVVVQRVELVEAAPLAREELDDHHPRDRLLQVGVEARDALADLAVGAARREAEEVDRRAP